MKVLIVYAHPNQQSFNRALLDAFKEGLKAKGHDFEVLDLYSENFNPVLSSGDLGLLMEGGIPADIKAHQEKVRAADGLVFVHPVWWTGMPAILKGWVDRVFSMGFAYAFDEKDGHPVGLLRHSKGLVISTAGARREEADATGMHAALQAAESAGIFGFCGVKDVDHVVFYDVVMTDDGTRARYLQEARDLGKGF